jgi:AcrR family transcriptional regulator
MAAGMTKENLITSALRLATAHGVEGASVRRIARDAGVTEGALYRHFKNKDDLWREVYTRIVERLVEAKSRLVDAGMPTRETLSEWVRLSYAFYDENPDAFTYVLLMPSRVAANLGEVYTEQSRLFIRLIERAEQEGTVRAIDPALAMSHFSGLMLSVPRLINEGVLAGPAGNYVDEVVDAIWRVLAKPD